MRPMHVGLTPRRAPDCTGAVTSGNPATRTTPPQVEAHTEPLAVGADEGLSGRLAAPLAGLLTRAPLFVAPSASVADVALAMREGHHSCAVVTTDPPGIVTRGDLQARVLAERRPPDTPVHEVMTRPVHVLPGGAPLLRATLLMIEEDVEHVPVVVADRVAGVVTAEDALRGQTGNPLLVAGRIRRIATPDGAAGYADDVAAAAGALLADGVDPLRIGGVVAGLNDALTTRLLALAEDALGPPPCPYAWLALGSQGRMEQLLHSDQDTALVHADPDPSDAVPAQDRAGYFDELAGRVTEGLVRAGIPRCPGGFMAPTWCHPLARWRQIFQHWVDDPDAQALLDAQVFLDFRPVTGALAVTALNRPLAFARDRGGFLVAVAQAARKFGPRLGLFGRVRPGDDGRVDLKLRGTVAVVMLGRLYGLAAGSSARGTADRLAAAVADGLITRAAADALLDAYRVLLRIRLAAQLDARRTGGPPGTSVSLQALSVRDRSELRVALHEIRERQRASLISFPGTD